MTKSELIDFYEELSPAAKRQLLAHILTNNSDLIQSLPPKKTLGILTAILKDSDNIIIQEENNGIELVFQSTEIDTTDSTPTGILYVAKAEFER
jgi:hypothetical protein